MAAVSDTKMILNEELPSDLRRELEFDAHMRDLPINDAATRILADHFKVEWVPTKRGYRPSADRFKLRVSGDLHREMRMRAASQLLTVRGLALHILSTHYGTTIVEPFRRPRREVA